MIDNDDKIPFWRKVGKRVYEHDCRFLTQPTFAHYRLIRILVGLVLPLVALYYPLFVNQYVIAYRNDRGHFKHGSIGSALHYRLPLLGFKALVVMYRDELRSVDYRQFGILYEAAHSDLPIGTSRRIVTGIEHVWSDLCSDGTLVRKLNSSGPPQRGELC
jgi:hypothetical protein